jgi:hypothetical protein
MMEDLVTSPELSEQLEAAGFPTDPALAWYSLGVLGGTGNYVAPYSGEETAQRAWSAQEIANEIHQHTLMVQRIQDRGAKHDWIAREGKESGIAIGYVAGSNLANVLGELWLRLKIEG